MSGGWGIVPLGTVGIGCAAAGLILWLAPRGTPAKIAACAAGGLGLAGLLRGTGLDRVESRVGGAVSGRLDPLHGGPGDLLILLLLILASLAVFGLSLGASWCWFMEAVAAKFKGETRRAWIRACASIGAFGWAMTVVYLWGGFDSLWTTDLFASAPPQGLVEGALTVLDMTGLVASFAGPASNWRDLIQTGD